MLSHIAFQIKEPFVCGWMEEGCFSQGAAEDVGALLEAGLTDTGVG